MEALFSLFFNIAQLNPISFENHQIDIFLKNYGHYQVLILCKYKPSLCWSQNVDTLVTFLNSSVNSTVISNVIIFCYQYKG